MNHEQKTSEALSGLVDIQRYLVGLGRPGDSLEAKLQKALSSAEFKRDYRTRIQLKTAITSSGINSPTSAAHRHAVAAGAKPTAIRDLLPPAVPIVAESADYPRLDSSTNSAGPQIGGSPEAFEDVALGESTYNFTLAQELARTIGHTVPISKQLLDDSNATALAAFIESEMRRGLTKAENNQLLNGAGTSGELDGLITNATAFADTSPTLVNRLDRLAYMAAQIETADFAPNAIVMNPIDWRDIRTAKIGSSGDEYVLNVNEKTIWTLPVVTCNQIAVGATLVGDFLSCGVLFEREEAVLEIGLHDGTNFVTNMATLKLQERVALIVSHPAALVTGTI